MLKLLNRCATSRPLQPDEWHSHDNVWPGKEATRNALSLDCNLYKKTWQEEVIILGEFIQTIKPSFFTLNLLLIFLAISCFYSLLFLWYTHWSQNLKKPYPFPQHIPFKPKYTSTTPSPFPGYNFAWEFQKCFDINAFGASRNRKLLRSSFIYG